MPSPPAYAVRNLRKVYRSPQVVANDGISFTVAAGEAFGLLGPNGAGKTTLVRQLVGLIEPTGGEIALFGEPLRPPASDPRVGRTVAYLPQGSLALGELKVREAVRWTGMLRGCGTSTAEAETDDLLSALEIESLADRQIRKLSGGQKRLTQIAMTLVGRLPVLILDEPTADIDPALRRRIWSLISARARSGAAVVLVTHDVVEAEHALDRVAIIQNGRVAAMGTPGELKAHLSHRTRLDVVVSEASGLDPSALAIDLGTEARVRGRRISAWVAADEALRTLEKVIASAGPEGLEDAHLVTPTLEDVYLEIGGYSISEEEEQRA